MLQHQITLPVGATVRDTDRDRYVIEGLLGIGGFGAVYLVRNKQNKDELFALKEVIDPNKLDHERFIFESEVLKRLHHRALPRVYRVFENEKLKRVYMLMNYVPGRNLEDLLKEQPDSCFSFPLALAIMTPIVDGLIYLHQQQPPIVHRDIKPANIIVSTRGEEAVLVDFGIAKEYVAEKTTTIIRHGSPGYAALEQYGTGTTPRTDIYALGATFYTLLTGTVPPDAIKRVSEQHKGDPLTPIMFLAPTLPLTSAKAIQRAMCINSEDRFETVEEFWHALTEHASTEYAPEEQAKVQEQIHALAKTAVSTPQLHDVPEQELEHIRFTSLAQRNYVPYWKKHRVLFIAAIALLLIILGGLSVSFFALRNGSSLASQSVKTSHAGTPVLQTSPHSDTASPSSTSSAGVPIYPSIASAYAGSIGDLLSNETTAMHLSSVQQNQGNISGSFTGLGLAGPFKGTVTPSGSIHFTVKIYNGTSTLAFEGAIKIGGDIAGSFTVLNQNGQRTGESGLWNVAISS
jgi:eukaryotic-like serine/threonine-protein kinase